jgi:hypothetical protein
MVISFDRRGERHRTPDDSAHYIVAVADTPNGSRKPSEGGCD